MSVCKKSVLIFVGLAIYVVFFGFFTLSNILFDEGRISILWSIPLGIILGVVTCLFASNYYDLKTWKPKDPNAAFADTNGLWGPPLGVLIANIVSRFFGEFVTAFVLVCTGVWLLITIGFVVFHSCRHDRSSKPD